jgi:hypothetical protein
VLTPTPRTAVPTPRMKMLADPKEAFWSLTTTPGTLSAMSATFSILERSMNPRSRVVIDCGACCWGCSRRPVTTTGSSSAAGSGSGAEFGSGVWA